MVHSADASFSPSQLRPDRLETAASQAIEACGGDAREAVKALIVANEFLERRLEELASPGYARGRVLTLYLDDGRIEMDTNAVERDRVPWRGVAECGSPRSPAWAGSVSWRLPGS